MRLAKLLQSCTRGAESPITIVGCSSNCFILTLAEVGVVLLRFPRVTKHWRMSILGRTLTIRAIKCTPCKNMGFKGQCAIIPCAEESLDEGIPVMCQGCCSI